MWKYITESFLKSWHFFCKSDQAVSCVSTTVSEEPKMHFFFGLLLKTGNG